MILLLRFTLSKSKRVNNEEIFQIQNHKEDLENININGDGDKEVVGKCTSLTVWRKSLVMSCNGFTVYDPEGNLAYRVDNYSDRPVEIVLMDGSGKSILTMRRHKTIALVDNWLVYDGEVSDRKSNKSGPQKQQPVWCVKKQISLLQANSAQVFLGKSSDGKRPTYVVEGSYEKRCCKVLDNSSKKMVAEIKRKESINGCASFGHDVFQLIVWPGFDADFAMTLVLLLDQMFS